MSSESISPVAQKRPRLDQETCNHTQTEEAEKLKSEVVRGLEKEKIKKKTWQLCPNHQSNGRAKGCSNPDTQRDCPCAPPKNFQELMSKIPDVVDSVFCYLDIKTYLRCRRYLGSPVNLAGFLQVLF